MLGSLVQIAATCAILYYFLNQNYVLLIKSTGLDPEIETILFRELRILVTVIGATFGVYLMGVAGLGVLFSHRIAGAIYALKRTIKDINEGNDSKLRLREGDEFQELVDNFNLMVKNLKSGSQKNQAV